MTNNRASKGQNLLVRALNKNKTLNELQYLKSTNLCTLRLKHDYYKYC